MAWNFVSFGPGRKIVLGVGVEKLITQNTSRCRIHTAFGGTQWLAIVSSYKDAAKIHFASSRTPPRAPCHTTMTRTRRRRPVAPTIAGVFGAAKRDRRTRRRVGRRWDAETAARRAYDAFIWPPRLRQFGSRRCRHWSVAIVREGLLHGRRWWATTRGRGKNFSQTFRSGFHFFSRRTPSRTVVPTHLYRLRSHRAPLYTSSTSRETTTGPEEVFGRRAFRSRSRG